MSRIAAPMKAAPMRAERIIPSQIGGSGSFMFVLLVVGVPAGNEKTIPHLWNKLNRKMQNF